jgi:hypothetical protein
MHFLEQRLENRFEEQSDHQNPEFGIQHVEHQITVLKYRMFDAGNNQIQTVEGLLSCSFPLLELLDLENNFITNVTFLYRLQSPKLIDLKLSKNKIVEIRSRTFRESHFPDIEQILISNCYPT